VIDRPAKHNTVTLRWRDLARLCSERRGARRGAARCGERAFCAGSDLASLAQYKSAAEFRARVEYSTVAQPDQTGDRGAARGWVSAAGSVLALAADIARRPFGKIRAPEVKAGAGAGGASNSCAGRLWRAMKPLRPARPSTRRRASA
jgi:enoyl-CoA hydratase